MEKLKNIFKYILCIFLTLIVVISFYTLISVKLFKHDYANLFGYTYFVIASGSMSPAIDTNDIIIVKLNGNNYKKGDIITYKSDDGFITHRITNVYKDKITTKGDANNTVDNTIDKSAVIGKVTTVISVRTLIRMLGIIIIMFIIFVLINFDNVFKKFITEKKEEEDSPLDYTISLPTLNPDNTNLDKILSTTRVVRTVNVGKDKPIKLKLNKDNLKEKKSGQKDNKKFLKGILEYLKNNGNGPKITKKGAVKMQYLYKLSMTIVLTPNKVSDLVDDIPFDEIFDYKFDDIGFTEEIRNKLYELPIYNYILIMIYAILYDNEKYFDAVFKQLKYRVKLDATGKFIKDKHKVEMCSKLIEDIIATTDEKDSFELEKIVDLVKLNKEFSLENK